jgi:hypothetical protein
VPRRVRGSHLPQFSEVGCDRSIAREGKNFELDDGVLSDRGEADVLVQSVNLELKRAPRKTGEAEVPLS